MKCMEHLHVQQCNVGESLDLGTFGGKRVGVALGPRLPGGVVVAGRAAGCYYGRANLTTNTTSVLLIHKAIYDGYFL